MYKQIQFILLLGATVIALNACNDSGSADDGDVIDGPIADLASGGVDLMTDDLNCGVYGNECYVDYPDGPFAAGGCNEGTCGPRWFEASSLGPVSGHDDEPPEMTCTEVCAEYGIDCVARGCSGFTAYTCTTLWGSGCSLTDPYEYPWASEGDCTEPPPWAGLDAGSQLRLGCCCQPTLGPN